MNQLLIRKARCTPLIRMMEWMSVSTTPAPGTSTLTVPPMHPLASD